MSGSESAAPIARSAASAQSNLSRVGPLPLEQRPMAGVSARKLPAMRAERAFAAPAAEARHDPEPASVSSLAPAQRSAVVLPALLSAEPRPGSERPGGEQETSSPPRTFARSPAINTDWGALPIVGHVLRRTTLLARPAIGDRSQASAGAPGMVDGGLSHHLAEPAPGFGGAAPIGLSVFQNAPVFAAGGQFTIADSGDGAAALDPPVWAMSSQPASIERMTQQLPLAPPHRRSDLADVHDSAGWGEGQFVPLTLHAARSAEPPAPATATLLRQSDFALPAAAPQLAANAAAGATDLAASTSSAASGAAPAPASASPSVEELARKVYEHLRRELRMEQERSGRRSW
jgi:hypothetical protein